jgi:putative transcriptional regulator
MWYTTATSMTIMFVQTKSVPMKSKIFDELLESTREALAHARGKMNLRTTSLPPAPQPMRGREVRKLRDGLKASQAVFAHYLNVSTKLVQAWEAERRRPEGAALALLRLCERHPALLMTRGGTSARPKRQAGTTRSRRQHAA